MVKASVKAYCLQVLTESGGCDELGSVYDYNQGGSAMEIRKILPAGLPEAMNLCGRCFRSLKRRIIRRRGR